MNHLENFLFWSALSFEITLCGFVFTRKVQRILPLFRSLRVRGSGRRYLRLAHVRVFRIWFSHFVLCLLGFTPFERGGAQSCDRGIMPLRTTCLSRHLGAGLRAFSLRCRSCLSFRRLLMHGDSPIGSPYTGQPWIAILHLLRLSFLALLLLFRNYYGIALEPLQRAIAVGICFICIVDVIGNTILKDIFTGYLFTIS